MRQIESKSKYKIVLINCYFGKFPAYYNLFIQSCGYNSDIDFLFVTDNDAQSVYPNIEYVKMSFEQLKEKIQGKFDFRITLDNPYKLCDYKPAYGLVFEDLISGYDFWGYCDIDMIFGDIRKFITDSILQNYDKLYQFGHLTLFRNTKEVNTAFTCSTAVSYKAAFTTPVIMVFDEVEGIQRIFEEKQYQIYIERDYADITPKHYQLRLTDYLIENKKKNNYKFQIFTFEKGHVYRYALENHDIIKDEYAYIHLQKRKMPSVMCMDKYYITNTGFKSMEKDYIYAENIKKISQGSLKNEILWTFRDITYRVRRKIYKMRGRAL